MEPFYRDNHIELYAKDCRQMTELADDSVQCVVTSPPYWGLRKYSGEQELIWGDNHCEHRWGSLIPLKQSSNWDTLEWNDGRPKEASAGWKENVSQTKASNQGSFCALCGAWKGAYGLEPTPEMYVQHTIEILREIRRVLRKDGVVFWNIGDSYAGSRGNRGDAIVTDTKWKRDGTTPIERRPTANIEGMKPKDLCLIPFRLSIAAQEDGWWVRSVIIWSKPNPMPESVTDRPTESHEYILMLTKSARYYWDADAVREIPSEATLYRAQWANEERPSGKRGKGDGRGMVVDGSYVPPNGRNIRTVWEFPTQPYPEAHFAVFPEKLPELCIKAATPEVGCCSKCGAPWERVTARENMKIRKTDWSEKAGNRTGTAGTMLEPARVETLGWQPTCKCNADKVPSIVLDPFAGAGTTLWVAKKLNRRAVGYEISEEYCELALERNRQQVML